MRRAHRRVAFALVAGAALGLGANVAQGRSALAVEWTNHYVAGPLGQLFVRALTMVALPLVFSGVALGVAGIGDLRRLGSVGRRAAVFLVLSSSLAAAVGVVIGVVVRPGVRIASETRAELMATFATQASDLASAAEARRTGVDALIGLVPENPLRSALDLDVTAIIVLALFVGVALLRGSERTKVMLQWLQALNGLLIDIVGIVMWAAPLACAALIFTVTSRFGLNIVVVLGWFVFAVLAAMATYVLVSAAVWRRYGRAPTLRDFFTRSRTALAVAFASGSSLAALPAAMRVAEEEFEAPRASAQLIIPAAWVFGLSGSALFLTVALCTLAQVFGVDITLWTALAIAGMSVVASVGVAGVPGGALPVLVGLLSAFGIPGSAIAVIAGVDRVLDVARTSVNVGVGIAAAVHVGPSETPPHI